MSALGMGGPPQGAPAAPATIQIGGGGGDPSDSASPDGGDWEKDLQDALAALRKLAGEADDHQEMNVVDKCIAALSGLTAKRQAGAESALGVTPAHKAMSRAY